MLHIPPFLRPLLAAAALAGLLAACRPAPPPDSHAVQSDLSRPALAVQVLAAHMRRGDFAAFARDAVPPDLHPRLQAGWHAGRTRWPLDELPFSERLPDILGALAAADAEAHLLAGFDRQFAGSGREIRAAAGTMGLFGVQYVERQGDFSDAERDHYAQLVAAVAQWAAKAPLADRDRAVVAIPRLVAAARDAGPVTAEGIAAAGMDASLARVGTFSLEARAVLAGYGLDLDAAFDSVQAHLQVQQGDRAQVRLRYALAGSQVDTLVPVERIDGRWYLSDYLRHAREAAVPAAETGVEPAEPASRAEPAAAPPPGPVAAP
jgi:hypothetical protein